MSECTRRMSRVAAEPRRDQGDSEFAMEFVSSDSASAEAGGGFPIAPCTPSGGTSTLLAVTPCKRRSFLYPKVVFRESARGAF